MLPSMAPPVLLISRLSVQMRLTLSFCVAKGGTLAPCHREVSGKAFPRKDTLVHQDEVGLPLLQCSHNGRCLVQLGNWPGGIPLGIEDVVLELQLVLI